MKQSIYQKLLLSLMLLAFFGTLASAQVMSRSDVDARQIQSQKQVMSELKAKAKAQGLAAIPQEWIDEARQQRNETAKQARSERVAVGAKPVLKKKVERKMIDAEKRNTTDIRNMRIVKLQLPNGKTITTDANNQKMVQMIIEANSN